MTDTYYSAAWVAAAWGLWVGERAVSAAWSWSAAGRAATVAGLASLAAGCAVVATAWSGTAELLGLQPLVASLHLGALVWFLARLPLGEPVAVPAFFTLTVVVPAAVPTLQPLLDAGLSFRAGSFPGWGEPIAPILALIALGASLPTPPPRPGWSVHEA
ncbi:MAG: hypothetical protein JNK02_16580 [Planctomycetes bacterium]|nr:hypothetical protein [Planctomycetota bacterium]